MTLIQTPLARDGIPEWLSSFREMLLLAFFLQSVGIRLGNNVDIHLVTHRLAQPRMRARCHSLELMVPTLGPSALIAAWTVARLRMMVG